MFVVKVRCDDCEKDSQEFLTLGEVDFLKKELIKYGWSLVDGKMFCEICQQIRMKEELEKRRRESRVESSIAVQAEKRTREEDEADFLESERRKK